MTRRVVIVGGGTGGHTSAGLSVRAAAARARGECGGHLWAPADGRSTELSRHPWRGMARDRLTGASYLAIVGLTR